MKRNAAERSTDSSNNGTPVDGDMSPNTGEGSNRRPSRRRAARVLAAVLLAWLVLIVISSFRSLPPGTHVKGAWHHVPAGSVTFLADLTYPRASGEIVREQEIFDSLFDLIEQAEMFLVLDFFLINDFAGDPESAPRALSSELIDALLEARRRQPNMPILLVTDPINRVYGGERHPGFERLAENQIDVVETRLERLRDSNPVYSVVYRLFLGWFGNRAGGGFVPNPFEPGDETTVRSWLRLLNFKANHRKLAVAGRRDGTLSSLVASANPHDASSGHSNVALRFDGPAGLDLLTSEVEVAGFSGADLPKLQQVLLNVRDTAVGERVDDLDSAKESDGAKELGSAGGPTAPLEPPQNGPEGTSEPTARLEDADFLGQASAASTDGVDAEPLQLRILSEAAIRDALLDVIRQLGEGDEARVAMFYMGHRSVVKELLEAASRGARVRLILDPNRDAFGREKGGIPNRSVAHELVSKSSRAAAKGNGRAIEVRWYNTSGEQFHTKMTSITVGCCEDIESSVLLGSANYTRRNIDDLNLETNVEVRMPTQSKLAAEVAGYFERLWANTDGEFTLGYAAFADESALSAVKYRLMERTGLSTF